MLTLGSCGTLSAAREKPEYREKGFLLSFMLGRPPLLILSKVKILPICVDSPIHVSCTHTHTLKDIEHVFLYTDIYPNAMYSIYIEHSVYICVCTFPDKSLTFFLQQTRSQCTDVQLSLSQLRLCENYFPRMHVMSSLVHNDTGYELTWV